MKHYSLLELNQEIAVVLEAALEPSYWVIAEIGQIQVNQKGHCYLDLIEKEDDMIKAKMRGTIWSYTYRNLIAWFEKMTGQTLKPGLKILFNAVVQYHEIYGISLNIKDIDANFTLGERALRKAGIIEKLKEDGVFEMNKSILLPLVPQRVAIISSPTAAGYGDFMDQLTKNEFNYRFHTKLYKAIMQGNEAEQSIISALHQVFSEIDEFDLVVLIRGGGASVDLDCFDSYDLSSHIAQFPIPVITGIGHERDETISDMVAHTKMKTPTAVSEFLITGMRNYEERIDSQMDIIYHSVNTELNSQNLYLEKITSRILRSFHLLSGQQDKKLGQLLISLKLFTNAYLHDSQSLLEDMDNDLKKYSAQLVLNSESKINTLEKYFRAIEPDQLLKRGFTITRINGQTLKKYNKPIKKNDLIETTADRFRILSKVDQTEKKEK